MRCLIALALLALWALPADRRANATDWHGCAAFEQPRGGEAEARWWAAIQAALYP